MFVWRYFDRQGSEAGGSDGFDDEASAEAWLGASWPELLDRGVDTVELVEMDVGEGEVRYRMGLRPEGEPGG